MAKNKKIRIWDFTSYKSYKRKRKCIMLNTLYNTLKMIKTKIVSSFFEQRLSFPGKTEKQSEYYEWKFKKSVFISIITLVYFKITYARQPICLKNKVLFVGLVFNETVHKRKC